VISIVLRVVSWFVFPNQSVRTTKKHEPERINTNRTTILFTGTAGVPPARRGMPYSRPSKLLVEWTRC